MDADRCASLSGTDILEVPDGRVVLVGDRLQLTRTACALLGRCAALISAPPPNGYGSWDDFVRSIGVPDELGGGADRIEDPNGEGPSIWFQTDFGGKPGTWYQRVLVLADD